MLHRNFVNDVIFVIDWSNGGYIFRLPPPITIKLRLVFKKRFTVMQQVIQQGWYLEDYRPMFRISPQIEEVNIDFFLP